MRDRVLIWGSGAIGGTIGAFLARAGHDVTFVDRVAEHVEAIRDPARGLTISGPIARFAVSAPAFVPAELTGTWDHVYLCVKSQDTAEGVRALQPHLGRDGYVVSLQNGLCEAAIAAVVGAPRTIGAFINYGSDWLAPGEVLFANHGAFVVGELDGRMTPRLAALHATVRDFCADAIMTDDIQAYLWGKLGYASFLIAQATGALGIADCLARPELLGLWRRLGGEVNAVAAALGIKPRGFNGYEPAAFSAGATEDAARRSVAAMAAFNRPNPKTHSGIWRDLFVRKRRTEVETQLGPIVERGAEHGLACPCLSALIAMIRALEDGRLAMSDDNLLTLAATPAT